MSKNNQKLLTNYDPKWYIINCQPGYGRLAQLVRAPALQAGGHRFESYIAHHLFCRNSSIGRATDL